MPKEEGYEKYKKEEDKKAQVQAAHQIAQRSNTTVSNFFSGFAKARRQQVAYARAIRRPIISTGKNKGAARVKFGRGRPAGPSGRYVIPGVGPVGVYEYRKWFNAQLQMQKLQARQQAVANMQRYRDYNRQALAAQTPPERRTIPDTQGNVATRSIHQEIDDAANALP